MKKPLKVVLITLGSIVGAIAVTLATTSIVNVVATNVEAGKIESYGQLVPVDGKNMNVVISGEGDDTIVLLPGFGTSAPALDFSPVIRELESTHRVVAVEPFGYGLSDATDEPRTTANIVAEVHEALQQLHIDQYVLMGHSIAGIYSLAYANTYPDEVLAFVGIDSSVPNQPGMDDELPVDSLVSLRDLGIMRILTAVGGDAYAGMPYDVTTKEQMGYLSAKNSLAPTYVDEMRRIGANFADASGTTFPADLPVLLFAVENDTEVAGWVELHEEQAASVDRGELILLDGGHYLHHTFSKEITQATTRFLAEVR